MNIQEIKAILRQQVRAELKQISPKERAEDSARVCKRLLGQSVWGQASAILGFAPLPEEVNIWPLIPAALAAGKVVCLPRFDPEQRVYLPAQIQDLRRDLRVGQLSIREPQAHCPIFPLIQLDLLLVPGVAFDRNGGRLGRGKGYYDRLLAKVRGFKCGVAFDLQVQSEIPREPHDVGLDCILTPTCWLVAGRGLA